MGEINQLSEKVSNKIAAGEVVERPASVVKELVENSIDAGSTEIEVQVKDGGKKEIQVIDNGSGMDAEDAKLAFKRHATSKIEEANDLFALRTLGFRGEALPSIVAVSKVQLITRTEDNLKGTKLKVEGGEIKSQESCGCRQGTNIRVRDLFFNTPVRYKYLKQTSTEIGHISNIINRLSLAYPEISFSLEHNGRSVLETSGSDNLLDVVFNIYGKKVAKNMIEVDYEDQYMKLKGYVSKPSITRSSRKHQSYFVNGRFIKSNLMGKAVKDAYHTLLKVHKYPIVVLKLKLNPILVDVNVHPTKLEAKFSRGSVVFNLVEQGVKRALQASDLVPEIKLDEGKDGEEETTDTTTDKATKENNKTKNKTENERAVQSEIQFSNKKEKSNKSQSSNKSGASFRPQKKDQDSKEERAEKIEKLYGGQMPTTEVDDSKNKTNSDGQATKLEEAVQEGDSTYGADGNLIPLGQIHQTYIVAQSLDGMCLIDQHALHERINYEKLLASFKEEEVNVQELLVPLKLDLTHQEIQLLTEKQEQLEKIGFEIEEFGGGTYVVQGVPAKLYSLDNQELIFSSIEKLLTEEISEEHELVEGFITMLACKMSVKAGDKLSKQEMNRLLSDMKKYDITNCPHGRPAILKLTTEELAKKFKRD
ncbi:MAG: DNA mismatch repair endonuclease MutL [Bacillota bacterium]